MTEKYFVGSLADCNAVRAAVNYAMGLPTPGMVNGVSIVTEPQRVALVALWWNLTPEQRQDPANWAPWSGWTLQFSELTAEYTPGTRHYCFVPASIVTLLTTAVTAGRTLTLEQINTLQAAQLIASTGLPGNWVPEPEPEPEEE